MIVRFLLIFTVSINVGFSQTHYPQSYFILPIDPGQTTSLAGCFGDIRINHFHAGLDIRTGGKEGKNVYAAADGYISRIKIQNGGYGNALYVTHPNGLTTVYAHLKVFSADIQSYLVKRQYESKIWEIDLELKPNELPVSQGTLIALSGNTGGSAGPHLHFEIRDAQENVIDPEKFGFMEVRDNVPPVIEQISLKCMSPDARINGEFGIFNFNVIRSKSGKYSIAKRIKARGLIGLEILTYDRGYKTPFRQGVSQIILKQNQENIYAFELEKMSFSNRLDMNLHVNYEKLVQQNKKIHKCYVENGNSFDFYKTNALHGKFLINENQNEMEIIVLDSFGNEADLNFEIENEKNENAAKKTFHSEVNLVDNFLVMDIYDPQNQITEARLLRNSKTKIIPIENQTETRKTLVYNLNEGIPEKIILGDETFVCPINTVISKEKPIIIEPNYTADFSNSIYDKCFVNFSSNSDELYLYTDIIPLKKPAVVTWNVGHLSEIQNKNRVYLRTARKDKFVGGDWNGTKITFDAKEFGTYVLRYDVEPPTINPRVLNPNTLSFTIDDNLSGINTINCWVNDEWVLMNYEYKTGLIWSEKLNANILFAGNVRLEITDNCDNKAIFEYKIPEL